MRIRSCAIAEDSRRRTQAFPVAIALSLMLAACVPPQGGWDVASIEKSQPAVSGARGHRLGDTPPYFIPTPTGLKLFLCRWATTQPIGVSLPPSASEREREIMRLALSAWEGAGLGVKLREVEKGDAQIEIRLFEADDPAFPTGRTGDTITDCSLPDIGPAFEGETQIPAQLVFASIYIRRTNFDNLGRPQPLSDTHLAGEVLHELGHALGYAGHAAFGDSVMLREHEVSNHWGRRVLEGRPIRDASLSLLYALPLGIVVGHAALDAKPLDAMLRFAAIVQPAKWPGPRVRVGETAAQLFWWQPGREWRAVFSFADWRRRLRDQQNIEVKSNRLVERVLARGLVGTYRSLREDHDRGRGRSAGQAPIN